GCNAQLVFCFNDDCSRPYPGDEKACPNCGTPNEMWEELTGADHIANAPANERSTAVGAASAPTSEWTPAQPAPVSAPQNLQNQPHQQDSRVLPAHAPGHSAAGATLPDGPPDGDWVEAYQRAFASSGATGSRPPSASANVLANAMPPP